MFLWTSECVFECMHVCLKSWGAGLSAQITESTLQPVPLFKTCFPSFLSLPQKLKSRMGRIRCGMNESVKNIRQILEIKERVSEREREKVSPWDIYLLAVIHFNSGRGINCPLASQHASPILKSSASWTQQLDFLFFFLMANNEFSVKKFT